MMCYLLLSVLPDFSRCVCCLCVCVCVSMCVCVCVPSKPQTEEIKLQTYTTTKISSQVSMGGPIT